MEVASGHVGDRPFARMVYSIAVKKFTGDLILTQAERNYKVSWEDGTVVAADSPAPGDQAGRVALSAGLVTSTTVAQTVNRLAQEPNRDQVEVLAEGCWRVDDAFLQPIQDPVPVTIAGGATLQDDTGEVTLDIPPGTLMEDSDIGVTILDDAAFIRDELPLFVSTEGAQLSGDRDPQGPAVRHRPRAAYRKPARRRRADGAADRRLHRPGGALLLGGARGGRRRGRGAAGGRGHGGSSAERARLAASGGRLLAR